MAITTKELIEKYPKIFEDYEGNPSRVNWYGVPEGWLPIIDILCGSIQNYIDKVTKYIDGKPVKIQQLTCSQMKEKFGGLRFYANGGDDFTEGMIYMAEYMCENTCQDCGSKEDIGRTQGWITTLCRNCAIGNGDRAMNSWKPIKSQSDV